jgi:hypothetical protein
VLVGVVYANSNGFVGLVKLHGYPNYVQYLVRLLKQLSPNGFQDLCVAAQLLDLGFHAVCLKVVLFSCSAYSTHYSSYLGVLLQDRGNELRNTKHT